MNSEIDTTDKQNMNRTQITNTNTDITDITTTTMITSMTTTTNLKSINTSSMSIGNNLYERRRNWRIHQMKSCIQPTNYPTTSIYNSKGDDGLCITSRKTDILHSKENWWRKTISHEPSVLITPFAQILTILNRARDFLSNYTSKIPSEPSNDPDMKLVGCNEKYINYEHPFDGYYVNELLNEFDWCLEVLDSLQSKRSVSSLTRKKLRNLLSQELAASINQSDDENSKENSTQKLNDPNNITTTSSNVHFDDTSLKKHSSSYQRDYDYKKSQINLIQKRKQQFTNAKSQVCEYICKTFLEEEEEEEEEEEDDDNDEVDTNNNYRNEVDGEINSINIGESHDLSMDKSIHINSSKLKLRYSDTHDDMMNESNITDLKSISSTQNDHSEVITTTLKLIAMNIEHVDDSVVENFIINNQSNFAPDLFKLDQISNHHPLSTFGFYLFMKTNTLQKLSIPPVTMLNCLKEIEYRYNSTAPFHNSIHALDVLHATYQLFQCNNLKNIFSDLEMFAIFFASAIHDIDHPGLTNQYLINTNHELALLYNDISVLENHHLHVAFKLINTEKQCDFTQYLTNQQKQLFRKMVITLVLSTDMSKHMSLLADLKTTVEKQKAFQGNVISLDSYSARMQILECVIHAADLSNPTKPLEIYQEWVSRIMEEMFRQGDQERQFGIEISPMCDRETACVYSTQIGFIDYIVYPLWETMAELLYPGAQILMDNIANNRNWYVNAKELHKKSNNDQ
ncbi:cAMP-specific 3',5'-cyclic phosphodiesterase 4D [Schistosoma japonicum]|nr:cAMP-specific 3',5'-cyclic phosphodiesterase 4D [Schistosoma japonicum]